MEKALDARVAVDAVNEMLRKHGCDKLTAVRVPCLFLFSALIAHVAKTLRVGSSTGRWGGMVLLRAEC